MLATHINSREQCYVVMYRVWSQCHNPCCTILLGCKTCLALIKVIVLVNKWSVRYAGTEMELETAPTMAILKLLHIHVHVYPHKHTHIHDLTHKHNTCAHTYKYTHSVEHNSKHIYIYMYMHCTHLNHPFLLSKAGNGGAVNAYQSRGWVWEGNVGKGWFLAKLTSWDQSQGSIEALPLRKRARVGEEVKR